MGRQINFYMSNDVQERFIVYLKESEFTFFNSKAQIIGDLFSDDIGKIYLYKQVYGDIIMNHHSIKNIDVIKSPIIEFKKTVLKKDQNKVLRGRLWINIQYYDERGATINKGEQILKDYQRLVRWIKKNVPYQQIKKGEHDIKEYMNDELKELYDKGLTLII